MTMVACDSGGDDHDNLSVTINGVRWATRNVGEPGKFVDNPWDYGLFHTFEEAQTACPDGWRVPSREDFSALCDDTKVVSTWTKQGGVDGRLFVDATTEKSIFLPAAGGRDYSSGSVYYQGTLGGYWSSSTSGSNGGYNLSFSSALVNPSNPPHRVYGFGVRCVRR